MRRLLAATVMSVVLLGASATAASALGPDVGASGKPGTCVSAPDAGVSYCITNPFPDVHDTLGDLGLGTPKLP
jgi:hypothetical protein